MGAENLTALGIDPRITQPIGVRYTNYAIPAHLIPPTTYFNPKSNYQTHDTSSSFIFYVFVIN
jgi:hypothetical protein